PSRAPLAVIFIVVAMVGLVARGAQGPGATLSIDALRPGMTGVGRTVFAGDRVEEFRVNILGVVKNVMGPKRDLIVARLEGGPLAETGVIAGMSGSPVYVNDKLIGAVSYALGSFPKEPIAGITPIAEMIDAVDGGGPRPTREGLDVRWPPTPDEVYAAIGRLVARVTSPLSSAGPGETVSGASPSGELGAIAAGLRPIGAAMVLGGFDPAVETPLARALDARVEDRGPQGAAAPATAPLQPGDAIGVSLVHGDFDIGATGTVTAVDGAHVYAFGHPFLELGPAAFPMTRATVLGILPSLDSSLKIATLGPVVGAITQDRATAIGGTLGPAPKELAVTLTVSSDRGPDRRFTFFVVRDPILTPLFTFTTVLNALVAYERQVGVLSIDVTGTASFSPDGQVAIDDSFSGDLALSNAATAAAMPLAVVANNEFQSVEPETLDLHVRTSEHQDSATIERAWLDTTMPRPGATVGVQVLLRHYRGDTETVSIPVTMPTGTSGPLTLLVSDAATLTALEQHEVDPARPSTFADTLAQLNNARRNNRLYVRLLSSSAGSVIDGQALPTLPASIQSVLEADKSVSATPLSRAIVGAWERRFDRVVKGSREIPVTLVAR
ncbi:MAG TPA: SpoIVB peptidase S55 domain-containing protein, partial [Vicinamibacterales bacterium]